MTLSRVQLLIVVFWAAGMLACSGDNATGPTQFASDQLTVLGNPQVVGNNDPSADSSGSFISVSGVVNSTSGLALTGLNVTIRVFSESDSLLGSIQPSCTPDSIRAGASCTFTGTVPVLDLPYTTGARLELLPGCDQGAGTLQSYPLVWQ